MQKKSWADCNRTIQWPFQQSGMEPVILTTQTWQADIFVIEIRSRSVA